VVLEKRRGKFQKEEREKNSLIINPSAFKDDFQRESFEK